MSGLTECVEPARDMDIREPKLPRLGSERRWASSDSLEPAGRIPTQLHRTTDTNTRLSIITTGTNSSRRHQWHPPFVSERRLIYIQHPSSAIINVPNVS